MLVLDRLWRGEITPNEKFVRRGSEYHKKSEQLMQVESLLSRELSEEGRENLRSLMDLQYELHSIENREIFFDAFRMGAGLMLDICTEYKGDFYYPAEE